MKEENIAKSKLLVALASRGVNLSPKIDFSDVQSFEWSHLEIKLPAVEMVF